MVGTWLPFLEHRVQVEVLLISNGFTASMFCGWYHVTLLLRIQLVINTAISIS